MELVLVGNHPRTGQDADCRGSGYSPNISVVRGGDLDLDMEVSTELGTTEFVTMQSQPQKTIDLSCLDNIQGTIHFAGIGGIGMSALARILLHRGYKVSGSDKHASAITDELKALGAHIFVGHNAENMHDAGALIISTAIVEGNPELDSARSKGLPVYHRSDLLNYLAKGEKLISVTGTHGNTTTTAMVGQVLMSCGFDPSIVVGGVFDHIGANSRNGAGGFFVAESDESDGTHVKAHSFASIITNIEPDHLENYPGGFQDILTSMVKFVQNTASFCVVCTDDSGVKKLLPMLKEVKTRLVSYGKYDAKAPADYSFETLSGFEMMIYKGAKQLGKVSLKVPGDHNKYNITAAIAVAMELSGDFKHAAAAAAQFGGVDRRFQIIGEVILVVDDYAHHPTEVAALLNAAREFVKNERGGKGRIVCVFQPHQPGRLKDLWQEFRVCFDQADVAYIGDIYIARGGKIPGIDTPTFVKEVTNNHTHYLPGTASEMAANLLPHLQKDDLVLTVGAGDITTVGPALVNLLKK